MKRYKMPKKVMTKGLCWKYALACILEVHPKGVPNFVTNKSKDDDDRTRAWLKRKFKKGLIYIPINEFLESRDHGRNNPRGGPEGYSIMVIETTDEKTDHVVIALNGIMCFNPCDNDHDDFLHPVGFYVIYDL